MAFSSQYTLQQALSQAHPFWLVELTNWGNQGASADSASQSYLPGLAFSAAAVAIGPSSTADQAFIVYTSGSVSRPVAPGVNTLVDLSAPLVGITGIQGFSTSTINRFDDTYLKDGTAAPVAFSPEQPYLQLMVYFQPPSAAGSFASTRRPAMYRNDSVIAGVGEQTIGIYPVMGRGAKLVGMYATGTLVANVRIGAIMPPIGGTASPLIERTVATGTINATTGATFMAEVTAPCSFLAVYFTATGGAGSASAKLVAYDATGERSPGVLV